MVLLHQHQDVVDVDFDLPDKFRFKNDVIIDIDCIAFLSALCPFIPQVLIASEVVLQFSFRQDSHVLKVIKGQQDIPHTQDSAKQGNKIFLSLLTFDARFRQREPGRQVLDKLHIAGVVLIISPFIALVVVLKTLEQYDARGILVAKKRNSIIHALLQISETDDIAKSLDRIENAVGSGECLNQTMHLQILIYPQGIQSRCIKTCQEHIDYDEQVHFLVLHPQRQVLVVVLELIAGSVILGMEHIIVVQNCTVQKITGAFVQS